MKFFPMIQRSLLLVLAALTLTNCEGFWGEKLDPEFIDVPLYTDRQVAYVPIQPVWDNFVAPVDITIGYDELIYIADGGTSEIIQYDQAGNELGRLAIPGLKEVVQDRTLDLLAIGTFDTLGFSLPTIYRIELKGGGSYNLSSAIIQNKIIHPFYFKVNFDPGNDELVALNGIAVQADNSYYVARSGPGISQIFGPDDAVLVFGADDEFQTPVVVDLGGSINTEYFDSPIAITGVAQPPQSPFVDEDGDFMVCMGDPNRQLKVQYIDVIESDNGISYTVKNLVTGDTSQADGFLLTANRFAVPTDIVYTGDGTNYMFVVDEEKDSLFQFTNTGLEGVAPPAGSTSSKNIKVSFGGTGTGLTQFSRPSGVAYSDEIVYVADRGNVRVLRFRLTTDFD